LPKYTPAQAEAIACLDEPLQIIACAGSGKTQVISQRIASILGQPGVEPRNIIAFTFTEKAAAELKERILSIMEKEGLERLGLAEMYVGTMHGYALDLLQRLVPETFKFSVLTEITARMFVDRNSRKSGLTLCPTSSSGTPYLRRFLHSRLFLQATSVLREDSVDWDLVPEGVVSSFSDYMKLLGERRDRLAGLRDSGQVRGGQAHPLQQHQRRLHHSLLRRGRVHSTHGRLPSPGTRACARIAWSTTANEYAASMSSPGDAASST
jgi:hypothetical protein